MLEATIVTKESLEHSINNLEVWLIVFACLVAIGVVGEFVAGWISWKKHQDLRRVLHNEEQQLTLQIEELKSKNLVLEKELLELKSKLRFRTISQQEGEQMVKLLSLTPKRRVRVEYAIGNDDCGPLATTLVMVLRASEITTDGPDVIASVEPYP